MLYPNAGKKGTPSTAINRITGIKEKKYSLWMG
jgi:hypothetical protein